MVRSERMKRWIIGGIILLSLLGLGGVWLWSLGSVPMIEQGAAVLVVQVAPVEVKRAGSGTWESASSGMTLSATDEVRTGAGGRASIQWFGRAESRIPEQTSIVVDRASVSGSSATMGAAVRITSGRIWSRVLRLFDLDESFAVTTNNVVATVRGTSFDIGVTPEDTSVWVADSAVDISESQGRSPSLASRDPFAIADGHRIRQMPNGIWGPVELISADDLTSDWFMRNAAADHEFVRSADTSMEHALSRIGTVPASGLMQTCIGIGERLHLVFAGMDAPRLRASYLMRRLNAVKKQIDEGRSGLAYQSLNGIERDLGSLLARSDAPEMVPYLRRYFGMLTVLMHDDTADSPRYRLKQRVEDFAQRVSYADWSDRIFAGLLSADARLDEAAILIEDGRVRDAQAGIDAARQVLGNAHRDLTDQEKMISGPRADALQSKERAIRARIEALSERIRILETPPVVATSTEPVLDTATSTTASPTSTTPTIRPTTAPAPTSPTPTPVTVAPWDSLVLVAQPNPVSVGERATLRLTGSRLDQTSGDLTSQASFRILGTVGQLQGSTFIATAPGSVTVEASILDHGVSKTAQTIIQVTDAVTLTSITITPKGSTTVRPGGQVPLTVVAKYSSGLTVDVTSKTTWKTSDPNIGSVSGNTFSAWPTGSGSVTITGSFSDIGKTVENALVFTVTPNAALY